MEPRLGLVVSHGVRRAAAICLFWATAVSANAQPADPHLEWHTLTTEHFHLHYHEPLGSVAGRIARIVEDAHERLAPVMGHEPSVRTEVVVTDVTDFANGSATAFPYPTLRIFVTSPDDLSTLGDYDDWLGTLVVHEHTHILHLDNTSGLPGVLNSIFGRLFAPNHVLPRWIQEGIATAQESAMTSAGRVRGSMFDMFLRMDALTEGRFLGPAELSGDVDRWPRGTSWYLYGSHFIEFVRQRYGDRAIAQFAEEYGEDLFSFGVNRDVRRATGETLDQIYEAFEAQMRAEAEQAREAIVAEGLVEGTRITEHGESTRGPAFLPGGDLVYSTANADDLAHIFRLDLATDTRRSVVRVNAGAYARPHPDGQRIVYHRVENFRDVYSFTDLFTADLETGDETQLTHGLRARSPDVSPNGRRVVFVQNLSARTHLMEAALEDVEGTLRPLQPHDDDRQYYTPRYAPDGGSIVYSVWRRGGRRDIELLDLATGTTRRLTNDRAVDQGPCFSPDGQSVFFSSDRTGVANIYRYDLNSGRTVMLTNVIAGAFHPAVSPDGQTLIYLGYSSYGFDLHQLTLDRFHEREAPLYVDTRPSPYSIDENRNVVVGETTDYSPLHTLLPRSWRADYATNAFGPELALSTSGRDALGFYPWTLRLGVGLVRGELNADVTLDINRSALPVRLHLFRRVSPRGGLVVAGQERDWIEDAIGGAITVRHGFPSAFANESVHASYRLRHGRQSEPFGGALDPNTPPPRIPQPGLDGSLTIGWTHGDVRRRVYDVSSSFGTNFTLNLTLEHPLLGDTRTLVIGTWAVAHYVQLPWLTHHVLALRYGGGVAGGSGRPNAFRIGGFPQFAPTEALLNSQFLRGTALRGYPPNDRSGDQFHLAQLEYRLPLFRPQWGISTLPFNVRRLYAGAFVDIGDAFFGPFEAGNLRVGFGAEIFAQLIVAYGLSLDLRVGVAYGPMEGGESQFYMNLGSPF